MPVLGEAVLDADGVLHGWCWSPGHSIERCTVEIVLGDKVIATLIASRFREDLRFREYGDGYHGFSITLTRHIANAARSSVLAARDHATGFVFWQHAFGEFAIPEDFSARLDALRASTKVCAHSPRLNRTIGKTARLSNAFGQLAETLHARAGRRTPPQRPIALPCLASPALSIVLDAASPNRLRGAASPLHRAKAELILTDDGADPETGRMQAQNLRYILAPGLSAAARRSAGAAIARGDTLVFAADLAGLAEMACFAQDRIVVSGSISDSVRRIAPHLAARITEIPSPAPSGFILAMPRTCFTAHGGFDASVEGLDILDWVLRAASNGVEIAAWASHKPPHIAPPDAAAERRFAERWIMGTALA